MKGRRMSEEIFVWESPKFERDLVKSASSDVGRSYQFLLRKVDTLVLPSVREEGRTCKEKRGRVMECKARGEKGTE